MPLLAGLAMVLLPVLAAAQSVQGHEERRGFRLGGFRIQPSIGVGFEYDSNIFLENIDQSESFIFTVKPEVNIVSDWRRHGLRLSLGAEYGLFTNDRDDSFLDYNAELAGVLDILRTVRVKGALGYGRGHEARGTDDVAATLLAVEPTTFDTVSVDLQGEAVFGRFGVSPFFTMQIRDFDDVSLQTGGTFNNDDRDRREIKTGIELSYEVRRGFSAFIRPSYLDVDYDDAVDDSGVNRDGDGFRILAGMKVDLTRLVEASMGLGYTSYDYDSAALQDFSGLAMDMRGVWSLTPRLQLTLNGSRAVTETTVAGASGAVQLSGEVVAEYDLLRTVVVRTSVGYVDVDFAGTPRDDVLLSSGLGVDWQLTRDITLAPFYRFKLRNSTAPGLGYRDHRVGLNATYRF
ncbi:MAG: outer membrane beta-barrel protein [Pseudomonadota bacterium]